MLVPPLGASGVYTLRAPFQNKLQANTSYRCDAIRRINDFIELGVDPYEEVYQPEGISRSVYDNDAAKNVAIVSLVSQNNHWIYVPSTYISSYPNVNGIPYVSLVLGVSLGAIPHYMDMTGLSNAIKNLVRDTIGVVPQITQVAVSDVTNLSQRDHDSLETNRQQAIINTQTDRAQAIALRAENATLRQQLNDLQAYIRDRLPPQA